MTDSIHFSHKSRTFEYFLFENFDADTEANNPGNPRSFLGEATAPLLSLVATQTYSIEAACSQFGASLVQRLTDGGILRCSGGILAFDSPIFLAEDAPALADATAEKAAGLADILERQLPSLRDCCTAIRNGFPPETNLYHILCGMVFDGSMFDYLSSRQALATQRVHPSGLNYISTIYENCPSLNNLSDGLLCSYNRFMNRSCSLQSFGDSQGNRLDFYRLYRLLEQGSLPPAFLPAADLAHHLTKDAILSETMDFLQTGTCVPQVAALLELLGYARNGQSCVPVFTPAHRTQIRQISHIVEACLGDELAKVLLELASSLDITPVRHGVNPLEIANELYHILFGAINEEIVSRGHVTAPPYRPGEGRYLQCIELL